MDLTTLGWNEVWEAAFAPARARGYVPALVVTEDRLAYVILGETGEARARVAGRWLHRRPADTEFPKVGDWVAAAWLPGEAKAVIHEVLPRRTWLQRKIAGRESAIQILAANVAVVFITQAMDETFSLRRLERFLVMSHEGGARPVVVLNKSDLCPESEARAAEVAAIAPGVTVVVASARTGKGMGKLRACLAPGETAVFLGTSGAGKSSLINRLCGEALQDTLPVRDHDAKGRHTTTCREVIFLPGGALVIDTPGIREFHVTEAAPDLGAAFPEIAALAVGCRFRDCRHDQEIECAVKSAVTAGRLDAGRVSSFRKLQAELQEQATRLRERSRREPSRPVPRRSGG